MSANKENNRTETLEFQAEVKKMLDIVIHSLYTEREIFLRELVSNASDALEKFRHRKLLTQDVFDSHVPLEILIDLDDKKHTLTITDTGIGMTRDELIHNLGTIAHSGSKTFLAELRKAAKEEVDLIGQFGVGFYAAFMVASKVRVISRSYQKEAEGHEWISDGAGNFSVSPAPGVRRGTKVILELQEDAHEFANEATIKRVIKQYSNFASFPIKLNGEKINTVQAVWTRNKNEIKEEEYNEFYKFIANAVDEPFYHLHFDADAPLSIKALLFVGKENMERLGFGKMEPGVNLYCKKVLIEQHSKNILPDWLRFLRGVVDSEDLPLNISRQALQDNALVVKLNKIICKRFLKFLAEQAKDDPETYNTFWENYGIFLKEGATTDFEHRDKIAGLLRFESSKTEPGQLMSLAEYLERLKDGQEEIYYINGPSREAIEAGPYVEAFKKNDIEIIYTLEPIDDFVFSHLGEFEGKKLTSADRADLKFPEKSAENQAKEGADEQSIEQGEAESLTKWMKEVLDAKVKEVKISHRLESSPAIIVNPDGFMTSSMERVMLVSNQHMPVGNKTLEINAGHPLIKNLAGLQKKDEPFARNIVEQIYDNALIQAGLMVEPRTLVERSYRILERAVRIVET